MIKFTIPGSVPSKKNQKQIIQVRGRPLIISSKRHNEWHKATLPHLLGKRPVESKIERLEAIIYADSKRKFDLSNKFESIADLLVDAGIIKDDNCYIIPEVLIKFGGVDKTSPRAEITIYEQ